MQNEALRLTRQELALREGLAAAFGTPFLSQPDPWDLVFALFAGGSDAPAMTRRDGAARCRVSSGLFDRWVMLLEQEGVLVAEAGADGRLSLTAGARARLEATLSAAAAR